MPFSFPFVIMAELYDSFAVGPSTMPCQLMVGFFAYAKSLDINVDKAELEGNIEIFYYV